ncbi:DUF2891 family protein [Cumulibacter manganitolerans]|uniref:DUF2891 family protein n=1 Tax=Cumulibacter manganitolerans TaxID=1884992 RepID=UPI001295D9F7|nr:DUF2891 family protein [Cumulibacter manganitolerans]
MTEPDPLARTVLTALTTYFPYAAQHVHRSSDDVHLDPRALHPAFCGSFDWHSSVHMQASAIRLLEDHRIGEGVRQDLVRLLDWRLTAEHIETEIAYLAANPAYERPYGWAWAAQLASIAAASPTARRHGWADAVRPLGTTVLERLRRWLPRVGYPVRHGEHSNTAFAMLLARRAAEVLDRPDIVASLDDGAITWYADDRDAPTAYEPSGSDFLSPTLCEAALLQQVLPADGFDSWLDRFAPGLGAPDDPLLGRTLVLDPSDGKAVHLHGLALSRAWLLRTLAAHVAADRRDRIAAATAVTVADAARATVDGDFMSTHWLVSFLLLAEHGLP